jgi:hypothetical protein
MEETRNIYNILIEKPLTKRLLGRLRHMWKDNVKMDFMEIVYGVAKIIEMARVGLSNGHIGSRN